jgi:SAM-dependent methyltransferase
MWKFNQQVADTFATHVRQHIPDYEHVLDKTIDVCNLKLSKESQILEIGCAIGETVERLHSNGFKNIHAVDASQDMLDRCPKELAQYYCSKEFPNASVKYDAVICNWTLHFIKDKLSYLEKIYNSLNSGGFLILSEKTENSGLALERYHEFKRSQGVSEEEIISKAKSLEGAMFIDSADWYCKNLKFLGFQQISIFSATWCFTSFVAIK